MMVFLSILWLLKEPEVNSGAAFPAESGSTRSNSVSVDRSNAEMEPLAPPLPPNAVPGEQIIHFSNRGDYLSYLQQLSDLGLSPLGTLDSLLAIRVSDATAARVPPGLYGGQERFAYKIEQPLPPADLNPQLFEQLRAFGMSARAIVGDAFAGDGSGVRVAVLDSGIEEHAHFDALNIDSIDLTGRGISGAGSGHGTAVASIIAGKEGIVPAADLLIIRVLDDQGVGSSFDLATGIVQAVDQGAQLINLSLGLYQDTQVLREAVQYAHQRGVLLVAAAGNDGYATLPYPAAYPQVLSVTAVDGRGRQAVFPNQSTTIRFAAPGVGIVAASDEETTRLFSGTSAAAPFVTGTLAAFLSANPNPDPKQAVELLERYLDDAGAAGSDPVYGRGLLNWDRLRERATTDIADLALADIYLQPDAMPGTTMPIEVTVQNRGTRWLSEAELTVFVGESTPLEFTVGTLAPGQTTTRNVYTQVPALQSEETLKIAAHVLSENPSNDVRPENNVKAVFFKPVQR